MASPTVRATATSSNDANDATHDVTKPTGTVSGDLWVVFIATDGSGASNVNPPSGWSNDSTWNADENNSGGCNFGLRWRICDGGEGATQQFTTSSSEHSVHLSYTFTVGTFDATTPVIALRGADATTANPDPPNLAPGLGSLDFAWIAAFGGDGNHTTSGFPTNYSSDQLSKVSAGSAADRCFGASAIRFLTASSEDPGTFTTDGSDQTIPATVAIQPSSAAPIVVKKLAAQGVG
jgi:hypothetical protein